MLREGFFRKLPGLPPTAVLVFSAALLVLLGNLGGCGAMEPAATQHSSQRRAAEYVKLEGEGWISVFLNLAKPAGPDVSMEITGVEVRRDNSWEPLSTSLVTVRSTQVGGGQLFLARAGMAPGQYDSLRLVIEKAAVWRG